MTPENISVNGKEISFFNEVLRKATHIGALVIPGGYYLLKLNRIEMLYIMVPIAVFMVFIDISRLRNWKFWHSFAKKIIGRLIRPKEIDGDFTGASYILTTVCLTVALYDKPIAITALTFIIVGDTFAALIGRRYGRHKIFGDKSLEGSLSCLISTLLVAIFVAILFPTMTLTIAISGAVVATFLEAYPFGIDDNVTVPILSGLFMTILGKILIFYKIT